MKMFSNKELRSMIITLFFEQLLVMLVGIVDTFVVSSCGEAAVSGVSLVNNLIQFLSIYLQHLLQEEQSLSVNILVIKMKKERFYHQVSY